LEIELQLFVLQSPSPVQGPPTSLLSTQPLPGAQRSEAGHPHTSQCEPSATEHGTSTPPEQTYWPFSSAVQLGKHFMLPSGALPHAPPEGHVPSHDCEQAFVA
jgi:hypothetical protein